MGLGALLPCTSHTLSSACVHAPYAHPPHATPPIQPLLSTRCCTEDNHISLRIAPNTPMAQHELHPRCPCHRPHTCHFKHLAHLEPSSDQPRTNQDPRKDQSRTKQGPSQDQPQINKQSTKRTTQEPIEDQPRAKQ